MSLEIRVVITTGDETFSVGMTNDVASMRNASVDMALFRLANGWEKIRGDVDRWVGDRNPGFRQSGGEDGP